MLVTRSPQSVFPSTFAFKISSITELQHLLATMGQSHCKLKPSQLQGCLSVPRVIEPNADLAGIGVWASFATTCAIAFTASIYLTWKYHWSERKDRGSRVGHVFTIAIVANTIDVQIITAIALIGAAINTSASATRSFLSLTTPSCTAWR